VEVHLATAFQNMIYDSPHLPSSLRDDIYAYLARENASERKPGQTDEQFYYTTRKTAFGPFKSQFWNLPAETKSAILGEIQPRFEQIFQELNVAGQGHLIDKYIKPVIVEIDAPEVLR
jgi:hypothetical protein